MPVGKKTWDEFAEKDPKFYIASNREEWTNVDFYAAGKAILDTVAAWLDPLGRSLAVEIGSGLGRLTANLAEIFERVEATDVSSEMIRQAQKLDLPGNIIWTATDGRLPIADGSADLVYSYNVMQHIPVRDEVSGYLRETARVLNPAGRGVIQFDTAPRPLWQRTVKRLPDFMLPRTQRRFIRRYPIPVDELREMVTSAGLRIADERDAATREHYLLLAPI
jgi:ubiquinone/menaquinone biosynthesis C-methylase UbiE